jgi:hypothetical protein
MAKTQDFTSFLKDVPVAFDADAVTNAMKTSASFSERFSAIAIDAAEKSNDITTNTVKKSLTLLRGVTDVQDEPADYAKAMTDFATAQSNLVKAHFEALGDVAKLAQSNATELFATTGRQVTEQSTKAANDAGAKAKAAASKAAAAA